MADDDVENAVSTYDDRSKNMVQRAGVRTPGMVPPKSSGAPLAKDYPDLFEEDDAKITKAAGPAVGSNKPKAGDYADLFTDTSAQTKPVQSQPDESGLFGALPRQIQEHPYIAGGLAALAIPAAAAVGAEVGIPALIGAAGSGLIGLLRSEGFKIGSGLAFGQELGPSLHHGLHSLLRLSGVESDH